LEWVRKHVGDAAQLLAQSLAMVAVSSLVRSADDRLKCVDVVRDQIRRHLLEFGRVLDDPAQAFRGCAGGGIPERRGIALMSWRAKQFSRVAVLEPFIRIAAWAATDGRPRSPSSS